MEITDKVVVRFALQGETLIFYPDSQPCLNSEDKGLKQRNRSRNYYMVTGFDERGKRIART